MEFIVSLLLVGVYAGLFVLYFLPTMIATNRRKRNTLPIVLVNILLGWTFIGWVGALVWACMYEEPRAEPEGKSTDGPLWDDEDVERYSRMPPPGWPR